MLRFVRACQQESGFWPSPLTGVEELLNGRPERAGFFDWCLAGRPMSKCRPPDARARCVSRIRKRVKRQPCEGSSHVSRSSSKQFKLRRSMTTRWGSALGPAKQSIITKLAERDLRPLVLGACLAVLGGVRLASAPAQLVRDSRGSGCFGSRSWGPTAALRPRTFSKYVRIPLSGSS